MLEWPRYLAGARSVHWYLDGGGSPAPASLGGVPQTVHLMGGPMWRLSLSGVFLRDREAVLAGRALQGLLAEGVRPLIIGPCDCSLAPFVDGQVFAQPTETAGSPFDDVTGESNPIIATFAADAALRATTVTFNMSGAFRPLVGGEHFSPTHSTWGRRMHKVIEVTGGTSSAPECRIRPPLRQAVTAGESVDFNRPSLVMQLASDFRVAPIRNTWSVTEASFVEYFGDLAA